MVPFDQIFYWNSGVNFADPGDPNDVVIGSFQGNSMGSLSSSDPEAATYTDLDVDGYPLASDDWIYDNLDAVSYRKWVTLERVKDSIMRKIMMELS